MILKIVIENDFRSFFDDYLKAWGSNEVWIAVGYAEQEIYFLLNKTLTIMYNRSLAFGIL